MTGNNDKTRQLNLKHLPKSPPNLAPVRSIEVLIARAEAALAQIPDPDAQRAAGPSRSSSLRTSCPSSSAALPSSRWSCSPRRCSRAWARRPRISSSSFAVLRLYFAVASPSTARRTSASRSTATPLARGRPQRRLRGRRPHLVAGRRCRGAAASDGPRGGAWSTRNWRKSGKLSHFFPDTPCVGTVVARTSVRSDPSGQ